MANHNLGACLSSFLTSTTLPFSRQGDDIDEDDIDAASNDRSYEIITSVEAANVWATRAIQELNKTATLRANRSKEPSILPEDDAHSDANNRNVTILAGLHLVQTFAWNANSMPLTMELAIETQPTVVFAFSHLNRHFLSEKKRRQLGRRPRAEGDDSGFPAQLKELLELPYLQPCGYNDIGHDLKRLQRYGVVRIKGGINVRKLAQRQGFSNAEASLEDLCRHYLPLTSTITTTTATLNTDNATDKSMVISPTTALRYQLVGRAVLDLLEKGRHHGTAKRMA